MRFIYLQNLFMYSPQRVTGPCLEADNCSTIHFHTVLLPVVHLWHCRARGRVVGVLSVCVSAVLERRVENDERVGKSVHLVADAKLSPVWVSSTPHSRAEGTTEQDSFTHIVSCRHSKWVDTLHVLAHWPVT